MAGPSGKEKQLLDASKAFHSFMETQSTGLLTSMLDPRVTLHKDSITIQSDIKGENNVKNYFQSYFDKYTFKHIAVAGAVDEKANVAFSLSVDEHVTPKEQKFDESFPDWAKAPSDTTGVWMLQFTDEEKIRDIWFLRQLSADEQFRKYKKTVDYKKLSFDAMAYTKSDMPKSAERAETIEKNTKTFGKIWSNGDPSPADEIMSEDVRDLNLIFPNKMKGREAFKNMIKGIFKSWHPSSNSQTTAVTPGNKAFVHWSSEGKLQTGESSEEQNNMFGMNMLVFNEKGQIAEIIGFRQPMSTECSDLLKAES